MKASALGVLASTLPTSSVAKAEDEKTKTRAKELSGKVVLITGAARGLGREFAKQCASRGASLILLDITNDVPEIPYHLGSKAELKQTEEIVRAEGSKVISVTADVRDRASVRKALAGAVGELGSIDILISNAGVIARSSVETMDEKVWRTIVDTNLVGAANVTALVLEGMRKKNYGRIIYVASSAGRRGLPLLSSYVASKWGVIGLCKAIATELAGTEITANAICPYRMDTAMGHAKVEELAKQQTATGPTMRRTYMDIPSVAEAGLFFTTSAANSITGEVLDIAAGVNAGWSS